MKPRTKLQKAVVKSAESLPPLSEYQRRQAIKEASIHIAKLDRKGNYICLECNHQWHGEKADEIVCPECGCKLKVDTSRKRCFEDKEYFAVTRKCNGFQVVRVFYLCTYLKKGEKARRWVDEAFQRWITPTGKSLIIGRRRHWLSCYCDSWDWSSNMELRSECNAHTISPYVTVGRHSVIPELIRNGFDGNFHECSAAFLFKHLLTDNRIETLWKVGQYELVRHFFRVGVYSMDTFWTSIKVAVKHHYSITDASMWCDLIRFLNELGKDVRNPKFICPADLKTTHDEWHRRVEAKRRKEAERRARRQQMDAEQRYLEDVKKAMQEQKRYKKDKSKFFGLQFSDNEIVICPLKSVKEFIDEGRLMHHCVFTNKYYLREDCLIFHALIDGVSVATIELNLRTMEIVQCRGKHNQKPEHYDRIVELINKNKKQIAQKLTA